jgi:protein tyrosine phosphatase (PTP) superfamily phosphohydrolase (DUF442 family)
VEIEPLHNVFRLNDRLYSGSGPDGEGAFAALQSLGVKTVISVDGAAPDVNLAERHGLRYVHLPIGYDGIPRERALQLAKAVRDLPGPVYVHCHHGKHRGPAAVTCVLLALDPAFTEDGARAWLAQAGTDPRYEGLVELPARFRRPSAEELDRVPAESSATAVVADLTRLMVAVDARWDGLELARAAGWKRDPKHPDLDPPHEALQLRELYREAGRLPTTTKANEEFRRILADAELAAEELERALRADSPEVERAEAALKKGQAACAACHAKFRDN